MQHIWKALGLPVVAADSKKGSGKADPVEKLMIKPSELPLYNTDQKYEYWVSEPSRLEEGVDFARKEIKTLCSEVTHYTDKVVHVYQTGKAHTMTSVDFIQDEENVIARGGVIGVGALLGLVIGMRKKGLIRKLFYTSAGAGGAAAALHPAIAYDLSTQGVEEAKNYAAIGYNFVIGVKPDEAVNAVSAHLATATPIVEKPKVEVPLPKKDEKPVIIPKNLQVEPDFGQSNPADKDMYTTRS